MTKLKRHIILRCNSCIADLRGRRKHYHVRQNFSSSRRLIRIGNVEIPMGKGPRPKQHGAFATVEQDDWLIPSQYLSNDETSVSKLSVGTAAADAEEALKLLSNSPVILKHLQWMMAKDSLQQDMLLIGPPGSGEVHRRRLALSYAEMMQKPIEILTISGDLTESDLKQRREIVNNNIDGTHIKFIDQAPVRAAKYGRLLLLDGIEKAERNVLPTLNNLLENREMHLEDGTILLPHHRCQELSDSSSSSSSFLTPIHPDFRVIALGVPSPPFPGRSLDPPFRSRFQIRRVDNPSSEELYEQLLVGMGSNNNENDISLAKSCAILASAMEDNGKLFPSNRLHFVWKLMRDFPLEDRMSIIHRAYPITGNNDDTMNRKDELEQFANIFDANHSSNGNSKSVAQYVLKSVSHSIDDNSHLKITFETDLKLSTEQSTQDSPSVSAQTGGRPINLTSSPHIVHTLGFRKALSAMIQEHASGNDFLLVSPKGEGKTTYAQEFAAMLGYDTHLFAIYSEMTSQDLLQRRSTDPLTGETRWEDSPLIQAAKKGDICVLDGIEKLRPDVLSSLQSLIVDRDIPFPDGRRALRHDRSDNTNDSLNSDSVVSVHPSFRVIALASLPLGGDSIRWITPNLMAMFSTIRIPTPTDECLRAILKRYASSEEVSDLALDAILALRGRLTDAVAEECGIAPLSTRNMIQVARRMVLHDDLHHVLSSIFLLDLLPPRQRLLLDTVFNEVRITETKPTFNKDPNKDLMVSIGENDITIGSLVIPRGYVRRPEMVPSPGAYDISAHLQIIHDLLRDWKGGERSFLLLGNQGVGKNKIIDRLCQIANWEREYIQLHRDSTIGQLTLTPQLEDGKIIWNDSPLIRAVRDGCALLIDEADKAPVEVVSVLKGLVEDGELLLADGRRISRYGDSSDPNIIRIHPNFSLWVLANRPGFPFHGNDFFREIGDCFNTRVVNNPDLDSEISLLTSYAPSLNRKIIRAIASSFSDLRRLSDDGDLNYPYSTREAIAVVKHLEKFPEDGIVVALHNILDFDSYDKQTYLMLGNTFQKHGIGISDYSSWKEELSRREYDSGEESQRSLRIEYLDSNRDKDGNSLDPPKTDTPKFGKWDENNDPHVGGNQWAGGTGGSDTAGLGGRGGPYRLDRGHRVHQVSDESKEEVSEQAKLASAQIAKKALEERLRKIGMGEEEYDMYEDFSAQIQKDVSRLKGILINVESRKTDRGWLKRQTYGEIDDAKLVDGITGDKYIYKRRGSIDSPSNEQNNIRFVMDVSGSMYRFNGYDQRLIRCLEAALLIMESFQCNIGESNVFDYSIVGHSGDSPCIPFVDWTMPPGNEKDRLQVLQSMMAHSQYCRSGDFTLEAMTKAIDEVSSRGSSDDGNNGTVICLSDANLARYGIDPRQLGRIIDYGTQKGVKTYIVLIASFGEEADDIKKSLPVGSGYICMETSELPKAVRDILTSGVLK